MCLHFYRGFKVIDQSGSCKFTVNSLISYADDSKACADVLFPVACPKERFHQSNSHSDTLVSLFALISIRCSYIFLRFVGNIFYCAHIVM